MMCAKPFRQGVAEFGCGQCLPCRLNRRRLWTSRLMLEAQLHESAFFVTLTYADEHLPVGGNLCIRDAQLFLKRLRARVSPEVVRYYLVGEYGDCTERPHYHAVLFGVRDVRNILASWSLGRVHVGTLTEQSAGYVVSYVIKGMTRDVDVRLKGRVPEFARMSLKPGIGAGAMEVVGNAVVSKGGAKYVAINGDVPHVVRAASSLWPLGRYLRRKLREEVGMASGQPEAVGLANAERKREELAVPGGRERHEAQRLQTELKVRRLVQISNSRKGIGL